MGFFASVGNSQILAGAYTSRLMRRPRSPLPSRRALLLASDAKFWLATRQMRHVAAHRNAVPAAFAATVTPGRTSRAADYTLAKGRFGLLAMAFGAPCCSAGPCLAGWRC